MQTKEQKEAFLELAHLVAGADGFVNRNEQGFLRAYLAEMDMKESEYPVPAGRELSEIVAGVTDPRVKNIFFAEILLLIFSDGDYNDEEQGVVRDLQRIFGFSDETFQRYKDWVIRMDQLKIEGVKLILK
ncbi:tellurite resistance TerB family protein [Paenibacillus caseinilyticus]|uniref:TerB family tellurite resistance protein n=1 Tax=Paenibacillus caseinilyticus TaxID=3098138 RepID=UPI0022B8F83F|nr:TerB family tellurite resistance protein [Paenibacillus caseinilyticus]MCZ8520459.1 TerB family tellurite resistance protein [Paenibacillus caseinilyticus]